MKRLLVLTAALFCAAGVAAQASFISQFDAVLESALGYGRLDRAVLTAPGEFGSDGVLTAAELRSAGGYTEQLSFGAGIDLALLLRWQFPTVALETRGTLLSRHAPYGYRPDAGIVVGPGPLGFRTVWSRPDPASWGFDVALGRLQLAAPTGLVVDQLVDGLSLSGGNNAFYVSLAAGVTGLVDKYFFSPRVAPGDGTVFTSASFLAPNRLLAQLRAEAAISPDHRVALSTILYEDLDPSTDETYLLVQAAGQGRIVRIDPSRGADPDAAGELRHTSQATLQISIAGATPAVLASTRIELRTPGAPVVAGVDALYASGGEGPGRYLPLHSDPVGIVVALPPQNIVRIGVDGTVFTQLAGRPVEPAVAARVFLVPNPDPGTGPFLAVETTGGAAYELLGDLSIEALAGFAFSPVGFSPLFSLSGRLTL